MTSNHALLEWERAEVERSGVQARLLNNQVPQTDALTVARYANPPKDTPFSWEYAFHLLGDTHGRRVLDLGCGDGECTTLVASHGGDVAALDISTDLLAIARTRTVLDGFGRSVTPLCGSVHSIPCAAESFDVVFGMAVLHHVDLSLAAQEVRRVLKPGGRAIFTEPIRNSRVIGAVRPLIPYQQLDISPFERPLRFDEINAFASGFARWEQRVFELPLAQLARVCCLGRQWESRAYNLDAHLLRRLSWLRRFASVVVLQVWK